MPIDRLACVLRFADGRAGSAFDTVEIGAEGLGEAIALAKPYACSTLGMTPSVAVLTDSTGMAIWSRRAPDHVDA